MRRRCCEIRILRGGGWVEAVAPQPPPSLRALHPPVLPSPGTSRPPAHHPLPHTALLDTTGVGETQGRGARLWWGGAGVRCWCGAARRICPTGPPPRPPVYSPSPPAPIAPPERHLLTHSNITAPPPPHTHHSPIQSNSPHTHLPRPPFTRSPIISPHVLFPNPSPSAPPHPNITPSTPPQTPNPAQHSPPLSYPPDTSPRRAARRARTS